MEYLLHIVTMFSIYAVLGLSLNLVVGYTGLLSVAHASFYGIGAYATAILLTATGVGFLPSVGVGVAVSVIAALLVGVVLSRFRGDYYALGSLGFCVIIFSVMLNWHDLTGGPLGISGIARPELFGISFATSEMFALLAVVVLAAVYAVSFLIARSPFGRVLKAIREDEDAIAVFGYRTSHYKLIIFVISAAMAAVAGSIIAPYITYIDPVGFTVLESVFILAIVILGGAANLRGSVLGAAILILLPEMLRFVGFPAELSGQMRELIYGIILVVLMLRRPQGLLGEYKL